MPSPNLPLDVRLMNSTATLLLVRFARGLASLVRTLFSRLPAFTFRSMRV